MKKINMIFILSIMVGISGCETMKEIVPPAWQSMDAFKKSLVDFKDISAGGKVAEPKLVADSVQIPSLTMPPKVKLSKGKISISNETKIIANEKVTYKYHYVERRSTQITRGYEQYHRTTIPVVGQYSDGLEFKLLIENNLPHSINSAEFLPAIFVNGNKKQAEINNPSRIIPGTSESLLIGGLNFSDLKAKDKIILRLYDVTTQTKQDGSASKKEIFSWDMTYDTVNKKLEEPLFTKTERVLIHVDEAKEAKLGIYYTKSTFRNRNGTIEGVNERWDPQTDQWYSEKQWASLNRQESLVSPEGTLTYKIGELN